MSILTQLAEKKITWGQAEAQAEAWAKGIIANDPALTSTAAALLSDVKQAASDAITRGDSALDEWIGPAAMAAEVALTTALAGATKGASVPFNAFVADGVDKIAAAIKAEADAWTLRVKAELASPPVAPSA